ncbi:DUF2599 domain-containing protein [Cellulomonas aerilata]|uniref:DUF2599 domain-containing protein n=1 Tax=Cellulomonas aerilata TaxID=515326 RepID=A0A512DF17_9CELL|nr:DUF2599 domain-containing protein [Cellulomonas aerilata]GEO35051.1 hypothetical protein CAE01nite_27760 [Cellulomonas aerilata]
MTRTRADAPHRIRTPGPTTRARVGRAARATSGLPVTLALAVALTGCGALEGVVSPPAPPAPPAASPAAPEPAPAAPTVPTADAVRSSGTPVDVEGATVLHVLAAGSAPAVRVEADGSEAVLILDAGDAAGVVDVVLAGPAGATLEPQDDGSVVVLAADGAFLGGAGRPLLGPGAAPARVTAEEGGAVHLQGTGTITVRVAAHAVLDTDWGEREGGRSLAVEPSPWARTAGMAGEVGVWAELVRAVPEADSPTMRDQLSCHVIGAPDKDTWNLEPWRPDVGLIMTLAASCNAT